MGSCGAVSVEGACSEFGVEGRFASGAESGAGTDTGTWIGESKGADDGFGKGAGACIGSRVNSGPEFINTLARGPIDKTSEDGSIGKSS